MRIWEALQENIDDITNKNHRIGKRKAEAEHRHERLWNKRDITWKLCQGERTI